MKIYLIDYNIDERENKKIYVSQYSSYKIGINVNGVDNSSISLIKDANTYITPEGDFKGYSTYTFEAGTPGTTTLEIYVPLSDTNITLPLTVITTDSTVAELSSGGGSTEIPADLELFSLRVGGEDPTISADASNLYLKGKDLKVSVEDYYDVIRIDDELYDPSSWEQYKGVRVNCDEIVVNKKIDCLGGQIVYNDLTGNYIVGNTGSFNSYFSSPGFNTYQDENWQPKVEMNANSITIRNDNNYSEIVLGEYEESITGERKSGLALNNVTQMIFRDMSGSPLTVSPIQITDGNGMTYTVLGVQSGV